MTFGAHVLRNDYTGTTTFGVSPNFFARRANLRSSNEATLVQAR
jgi:hypothetical protein